MRTTREIPGTGESWRAPTHLSSCPVRRLTKSTSFHLSRRPSPRSNSTIYSDTMKWIRFKKPGKYMVVYVDLRMGKCVCGIHYDMRGMKRMISDDRYVLVEVTLPGRGLT